MSSTKTHGDYTIGWICPLVKEHAAARLMLDEVHDNLSQPVNDANAYVLGSIKSHNIAVAGLPIGHQGLTSTASVATSLIRSFPSIRVVLVVGIGGGVPQDGSDLKLGDVVVGRPSKSAGHAGVVHWDFGKEESDGFRQTGHSNSPPTFILTALATIASKLYLDEPSEVNQYIKDLRASGRRGARKFLRNETMKDILFPASYGHVLETDQTLNQIFLDQRKPASFEKTATSGCTMCNLEYATRIIDPDDTEVKIHFGLIASGNRLVKNAVFRDSLKTQLGKDLLCVEMEAAGLVDFPYLAIRGICDYADTHKNDDWQEYAALTAAGFAKELVTSLPKHTVEAQETVQEIVNKLDTIEAALLSIENETVSIASKLKETGDNDTLEWLGRSYRDELNSNCQQICPGTGQWFLESQEFKNWTCNDCDIPILFCPGDPGTGKTSLISITIDHLFNVYGSDPQTSIIYIYCSYMETPTLQDLVSSLLRQLVQTITPLPTEIQRLRERYLKQGKRPFPEELSTIFSSIAQHFTKILLVVDALDECSSCSSFLPWVFDLQKSTNLRFLATSRLIPNIAKLFNDTPCSRISIKASDADVRLIIGSDADISILSDIGGDFRGEEAYQDIINRLVDSAGGMILLPMIYLRLLKGSTTWSEVQNLLKGLAARKSSANGKVQDNYNIGYDDAYKKTLTLAKGQPSQLWGRAKRAFYWLLLVREPLDVQTFQRALSIERDQQDFDTNNIPSIDIILRVCRGLVVIEKSTNTVRFVHQTVHEYFQHTWEIWFPEAKTELATVMATYLLYNRYNTSPPTRPYNRPTRNKQLRNSEVWEMKLYRISATDWGHHARDAGDGNRGIDPELASRVLHHGPYLRYWRQPRIVQKWTKGYFPNSWSHPSWNSFYLASYFGLKAPAQAIWELRSGESPVDVLDFLGVALSMATISGQIEMVKWLLDRGADVNRSFDHVSALHIAALCGHGHIVKTLLINQANVNIGSRSEHALQVGYKSRDMPSVSPLTMAIRAEHGDIATLLVKHGADLTATIHSGEDAITILTKTRQIEKLDELLMLNTYKSSVENTRYCALSTSLLNSIRHERWSVVRALASLKRNFNNNWRCPEGRTLIGYVANIGYGLDTALEALLEKGLNPETRDKQGRTALIWATISHDNTTILSKLLRTSRNESLEIQQKHKRGYSSPATTDHRGWTALTHALYYERKASVVFLLNHLWSHVPQSSWSVSQLKIDDSPLRLAPRDSTLGTLQEAAKGFPVLEFTRMLSKKAYFCSWAHQACSWVEHWRLIWAFNQNERPNHFKINLGGQVIHQPNLDGADLDVPYLAGVLLLSEEVFAWCFSRPRQVRFEIDEHDAYKLKSLVDTAELMSDIVWCRLLLHRMAMFEQNPQIHSWSCSSINITFIGRDSTRPRDGQTHSARDIFRKSLLGKLRKTPSSQCGAGKLSSIFKFVSRLNDGFYDQSSPQDINLLVSQLAPQISQENEGGMTLLMWAVCLGYDKAMEILISGGASMDECDDDGNTALYWAVKGRRLSAIFLLLKGHTANLPDAERDGKYTELEKIIISAWANEEVDDG